MHVLQFDAMQCDVAVKWDATGEFRHQFQDNPLDPWLYQKSPNFLIFIFAVSFGD